MNKENLVLIPSFLLYGLVLLFIITKTISRDNNLNLFELILLGLIALNFIILAVFVIYNNYIKKDK